MAIFIIAIGHGTGIYKLDLVLLAGHVLRYHEEMAHSHRSGNRDEIDLVIVIVHETGMKLIWS